MSRFASRFAVAAIVVGWLMGWSLVGAPAMAAVRTADAPPPASPQSTMAGCVRQHNDIDVLMVFDTSGSLGTTDPKDLRMQAGQVAVTALQVELGHWPNQSGTPPTIDIAVAGFAGSFEHGDWHDASDAAAINGDLGRFAARQDGAATDYVVALSNARGLLAQHAAASGARPPCQVMIWLTDGMDQPQGDASTQAQIDANVAQLCDPGGIVDQLRTDGVTIVTVALTVQMQPPAQDLLERISATGGSGPCGTRGAASPGVYLPVGDSDQLATMIPQLFTPPAPLRCASATCTFTLDPFLRSFLLVIQVGRAPGSVLLSRPDGESPIQLSSPGQSTPVSTSGVDLTWAWLGNGVVAVTGDLPQAQLDSWVGVWQVSTTSAGQPVTGQVYLLGNLVQQMVGRPVFERGKAWRFRVETVSAGSPAAMASLAALHPQVRVSIANENDRRDVPVALDPHQPGAADVDFVPPPDWHASEVRVTVDLVVHTEDGIDISPARLTVDVPVATPLLLRPTALFPPSTAGEQTSTDRVTVSSTGAPGCVWVDERRATLTDGEVPVDVTTAQNADSPAHCLRIPANTSRSLDVRFTPRHGWTGRVSGNVPLMETVGGNPPVEVDLPAAIQLSTRPDQVKRALILLAMGGVTLLPLLGAIASNYAFAVKFHNGDIRVASFRARVVPGPWGVRVERPESPAWLTERDAEYLNVKPKRTLPVGVVRFRAWLPLIRPLGVAATRVDADGRTIATATAAMRIDGPATVVDGLPLRLDDIVVLARRDKPADDPTAPFDVDVVTVLGTGPLDDNRIHALHQATEAAARRLAAVHPVPV